MSIVLLLAFLSVAGVDWWAVARKRAEVEYLAKPAALVSLILFALAGPSPSAWLVTALVFSLLGDVYLMLPGNFFATGLAAFLLAHIAYIVDFHAAFAPRFLWLIALGIISSPITARIVRSVPQRPLGVAVATYIAVILLMAASAAASGSLAAAAGALLFVASDSLIAWDRFVRPIPWGRTAVILTYHLGQLGLVLALR